MRKSRCRRFWVKLYRSSETSFACAFALGAARLDAKDYTFTGQGHSEAGMFQFGEQDLQLDECSHRRQLIRQDVYPGSVDVTSNALALLRLSPLGCPQEDGRSAEPVTIGFSQFYDTVHGVVAFTAFATGEC